MMENDNGTLRSVAWSEICPWLGIVRAFRLAISVRVLTLAAAGIFLTLCGWAVLGNVFLEDSETPEWISAGSVSPWTAVDGAVPNRFAAPDVPNPTKHDGFALAPTAWKAYDPFFGSWAHLSRPLWDVFLCPDLGVRRLACLLLCGLWSLAVWAFFGGAITRIAAVGLASEERIGWAAAMRYAWSKWPAYCGGPLFPLIGILLAAVPVGLLGLLLWPGGAGVVLAAVAWPLALVAGLVMAVLLLGLVFGWPLMWGTISTEGSDSYDALGRCYSYAFRRPLHYLFYAVVAAVIGGLGWLLVKSFAAGVIGLAYWAAGCGAGPEKIQAVAEGSETLGSIGGFGAEVIHFWTGCVKLLALGYVYGFFWTASTFLYLLLRHDVDATEMDEVFLDEDASEPTYGLPPLTTDEAGAPMAVDDVPEVEPDDDAESSQTPGEEEL